MRKDIVVIEIRTIQDADSAVLELDDENKTDVFQRMISEFPDSVWRARQHDRIEQDVLAHKTLRKYKKGELMPCEDSRRYTSA
ncbi:MAG: hypothetical protein WBA22_19725 [Candidatus Methanofastidiosia archaeon]|jgi:hypothetical protein